MTAGPSTETPPQQSLRMQRGRFGFGLQAPQHPSVLAAQQPQRLEAGPRHATSRFPTGASATQNFRIMIAGFPRPPDSRRNRPRKCPVTGANGTFKSMTGLLIGYAQPWWDSSSRPSSAVRSTGSERGRSSWKADGSGMLCLGPRCTARFGLQRQRQRQPWQWLPLSVR